MEYLYRFRRMDGLSGVHENLRNKTINSTPLGKLTLLGRSRFVTNEGGSTHAAYLGEKYPEKYGQRN